MDLETVLAKLSDEEKSVIIACIEAEKTTGINASKKKGEEIKALITKQNRLKDAIRALELDPESEDIDSQIGSLKDKIKGGGNAQTALEKQLAAITKQLDAITKERDETAKRLTTKTISERLTKALGDKVHAPEYIIKTLIADGSVTMNGDDVVWKNGDSELDLDSGAVAFLKANPNIVKVNQKPGGGSSGGNGTGKTGKTMSESDYHNLPLKDRAAFFADGGKIV